MTEKAYLVIVEADYHSDVDADKYEWVCLDQDDLAKFLCDLPSFMDVTGIDLQVRQIELYEYE